MTPEETRYYDDYYDMFTTPGWSTFIQEIESARDSARAQYDRVIGEQSMGTLQGEVSSLNRILALELSIRSVQEQVKLDEAEVDENGF